MNEPKKLLTVKEAADQLSLSRSTIYELIGGGSISVVRIGRAVRVPASVIQDFVQRLTDGVELS